MRRRPEGTERTRISPTGEVEIYAQTIEILNRAEPLPFQLDEDGRSTRRSRLKYRYIDLRRPVMQRNLRLRHDCDTGVQGISR